ncbi:MAG: ABC transporter permease [Thaumarchaeota archaeon]|nr:ABC transporter permease [Nitrososphaerota archaeon]
MQMRIPKAALLGIIPITIILVVWQVLSQEHIVSPVFLPPVTNIVTRLIQSFTGGNKLYALPQNLAFTLERMFLGYGLAAVIAIPLGVLIGSSKKITRLLEPTIEVFRPLPPVALIPIFILLFGINDTMYVVFVAFGCIWPILINTIDGVKNIEPMFFDVAKSFNIGTRKIFLKITLPASSPFIVSGLRVSLLLSLLLTIVIEMVSSFNGLGWATIYAQQLSDVTTLYAEIFLIAVLGFLLNLIFIRGENSLMSWHKRFTKGFLAQGSV